MLMMMNHLDFVRDVAADSESEAGCHNASCYSRYTGFMSLLFGVRNTLYSVKSQLIEREG